MATDASALSGGGVRIRRQGLPADAASLRDRFGLSPRTLAIIRWTQVLGQLATVLIVALVLRIDLPLSALLILIAIGAASTAWALRQLQPPRRLDEARFASILLLDAAQIGALLALTGALANPFSLFLLFPAILAATTLGAGWCMLVCCMVMVVATLLALVDAPVLWLAPVRDASAPWAAAGQDAQALLTLGNWVALTLGTVLIATYAWRIAEEGRRMARALSATQLALEREQRLSHLDGLATAAAHDLGTPLSTIAVLARDLVERCRSNPELIEDARTLHQQARRCRDILAQFTRDAPIKATAGTSAVPLSLVLERLCADQQNRAVDVHLQSSVASGAVEPAFPPAGEVRHALANLLDNAVTYARSTVKVRLTVDRGSTVINIVDDGPGFPAEVLSSVGEPFVSTRGGGSTHGLGLFVACTFLTRAEAELEFANSRDGASITIVWEGHCLEGRVHGRPERHPPTRSGPGLARGG